MAESNSDEHLELVEIREAPAAAPTSDPTPAAKSDRKEKSKSPTKEPFERFSADKTRRSDTSISSQYDYKNYFYRHRRFEANENSVTAKVPIVFLATKWMASGAADFSVVIWDVQTGKRAHSLVAHKAPVTCLAKMENAPILVSGGRDKIVVIWNYLKGTKLDKFDNYYFPIRHLVTFEDNRVATAAWEVPFKICYIKTGNIVRTDQRLETDVDVTNFIALNQDALATTIGPVLPCKDAFVIHIWNSHNGTLMQTLKRHTQEITRIMALGENQLVSASEDCTVIIWDTNYGSVLRVFSTDVELVCQMARVDAVHFAAGTKAGTTIFYNSLTGETHRDRFHRESTSCLIFVDDAHVAQGYSDGVFSIISSIDGSLMLLIHTSLYRICGLVAVPTTGHIVAGSFKGEVETYKFPAMPGSFCCNSMQCNVA